MRIEPLPITSFLQTSFSRRKTREMLYKLVEDWHNSVSTAQGKWQYLSNNNNNKLYLHKYNKVLQYCKSYLNLIIDSFLN